MPSVNMIDRYGYSWMGWYYTPNAFKIDNDVDFSANQFVQSGRDNQFSKFAASVIFDYEMLIKFVNIKIFI
jgi:hypothetical protein